MAWLKWDIDEVWAELVSRGKGWVRRAKQGVETLDRFYPDIMARNWLTIQKQPKRVQKAAELT